MSAEPMTADPMTSEPAIPGPRLATAAETLLVGVLVCAASLPIVTALAAAGAGAAALAEFAESGTPVRFRRFLSLLRAALADPLGW
ncbi:MAG: Poxvirus protein I5, partial [Catenulispora sp.]|nr:Poxvirus protein I5 [Catenulispora sp.]